MLRVLLVEEHGDRAQLVREGLLRAGHEVVGAINSPLALLEAIDRTRPDIVVIAAEMAIALAEANQKLEERKLVERAKGLLMSARGLGEDEAYHALRKLAMAKQQRLGEVAQQVIDTAALLGKA